MISTVKELKAKNVVGHSVYRLSGNFEVHTAPNANGDRDVDVWTPDDVFIYDGKVLTAVADRSQINPAILFKAKVSLLTPKEWR